MATTNERLREVDYPTSDGKPMAETQLHAQAMIDLIETLQDRFADDPDVYVWGNLLLYYEEGNPRKHISPDVFLVRGVPKLPPRDYYLVWKEKKSPDLVIEITSKTTRREDQSKKRILYRDVLKVPEYFQFDPTEDYLKPPLQGHRLVAEDYVPIAAIDGRLPSAVLGLHLERDGLELRLHDPAIGSRLLKREERRIEAENARLRAEIACIEAEDARQAAETARNEAETRTHQAEAEIARLRRELEAVQRARPGDV